MFDSINEVAVIGTAFLMMAIGSIWYSTIAFGKPWMKAVGMTENEQKEAISQVWKYMFPTLVSYIVVLSLLSLCIVFAPRFNISVFQLSLYITFGYIGLLIPTLVWEKKPFSYFLIMSGFSFVFIVGGMAVLQYWPW